MESAHTALLNALGLETGLDLSLDENGQCALLLDDRLMISIRAVEGAFIYYGMLGEFPGRLDDGRLQRLLALNTRLVEDGLGIGIEPDTEAVLLLGKVQIAHLDALGFSQSVAGFADSLEALIELFDDDGDEGPDGPAPDGDVSALPA